MGLELSYNLRHLATKRVSTLLTLGGISLVVFVFVATLMLAAGLEKTFGATGSFQNAIVIRNGAQNEIQSGINREHANIIVSEPEVMRVLEQPLATFDTVVVVSLKKREDAQPSNVNIRGVSGSATTVREGIRIIAGRAPAPGAREVMVGRAIQRKFSGTDIGQSIRLVGTDWPIVGIFDAGNSAFSSEIWGDVNVLMPSFKRDRFSSVTFRLVAGADFENLKHRLENEPRLSVTVKREQEFYAAQSSLLAKFITYIGGFISVIFSFGAVIGAMITMYSAVSNRTREIAILRILGFSRWSVFVAFVKESAIIGLLGGVVGVLAASILSNFTITTINYSTFAEIAFGFALTPSIACWGVGFALIMGLFGGALPAWGASRMKILDALRA